MGCFPESQSHFRNCRRIHDKETNQASKINPLIYMLNKRAVDLQQSPMVERFCFCFCLFVCLFLLSISIQ